MSEISRYRGNARAAVTAGLLVLAACGGSSDEGARTAAGTGSSAIDGSTTAAAPSTSTSKDGGLCSRVDVATVNDIFGVEPPFEQGKPHGLLPLPGAVTCTFHDGAARTVTVSGVENAPGQYDAFLAHVGPAGRLTPIDGIGDKAAGGVRDGISAEVAFLRGAEFGVVVCVDTDQDKDRALFEKCKLLASHLAA